MYTKESIEKLRKKTSLRQVVSKFIPVLTDEISFYFSCPFHEKFHKAIIDDNDTHFDCRECGVYGDALSFLMMAKMMGYRESMKYLADLFEVTLEQTDLPIRSECFIDLCQRMSGKTFSAEESELLIIKIFTRIDRKSWKTLSDSLLKFLKMIN